MTNMCPVCGYQELKGPAYHGPKNDAPSFEICPSCFFQFGYDDDDQHFTHTQWRQSWIASGMPWNGKGRKPPENWNPVEQLKNIGVTLTTN